MTYLNLYLIDEDPVENMLQIVTVQAGFNIIAIQTSGLIIQINKNISIADGGGV